MTIFVIIRQAGTDVEKLGKAIASAYPDDIYDLGDGAWLVSDTATAKDISDNIGITDGKIGSAVIIETASYFGRANPAIWSWIKAKWNGAPNG
ncbi:MAG: hypothetical protein IIC03_03215 [Proteobacteria bacterium]|nr:hypothetical protein [Pseudomonadota bacterium]